MRCPHGIKKKLPKAPQIVSDFKLFIAVLPIELVFQCLSAEGGIYFGFQGSNINLLRQQKIIAVFGDASEDGSAILLKFQPQSRPLEITVLCGEFLYNIIMLCHYLFILTV